MARVLGQLRHDICFPVLETGVRVHARLLSGRRGGPFGLLSPAAPSRPRLAASRRTPYPGVSVRPDLLLLTALALEGGGGTRPGLRTNPRSPGRTVPEPSHLLTSQDGKENPKRVNGVGWGTQLRLGADHSEQMESDPRARAGFPWVLPGSPGRQLTLRAVAVVAHHLATFLPRWHLLTAPHLFQVQSTGLACITPRHL